MKKITLLVSALLLTSAVYAQSTTAPNTSNTVSPCSANTPLVGNGASVAPKCHASGALGTAAFNNTGTSGATVPLNNGGFTQSGTSNFTGAFQVGGFGMTFPGSAATVARTDAAQTFTGNQTFSGAALSTSPSAGEGYTTGAGGAVTQLTNRATAVTLNTVTGAITLATATAVVGTWISFTVNDSSVGANDVPHLAVRSNTNTYVANVSAVTPGAFQISFMSIVGTASDTPVINFTVTKGSIN